MAIRKVLIIAARLDTFEISAALIDTPVDRGATALLTMPVSYATDVRTEGIGTSFGVWISVVLEPWSDLLVRTWNGIAPDVGISFGVDTDMLVALI